MNKWLLLLIVIGLGVFGWLDQDKIRTYLVSNGYGHYLGKWAPGTPNPAMDSRDKAMRAYPALSIANSALNARFLALYNDKKEHDPDFLTQDDWPLLLAQQAATDLGGAPMPIANGGPVPQGGGPTTFKPSPLESRPTQPQSTVAPTVQLPGLMGTSLDQRPNPQRH